MEKTEKLNLLEEMMDLEEGTLKAEQELREIEAWDSIARLSLVILLEDEFDKQITAKDVRGFETVGDILNAMEA